MNDLEARRLLLADPRHLSPELREAIDSHPQLAEFREELLRLDERLRAAATGAAVPDGLADRLVLGARYRSRPGVKLAIAAAIVSLAIAIPWHAAREQPFEVAMMDHVRESTVELRDDSGVEPAVLRTSLQGLGVGLRDTPYRVRHLGHCIVGGIQGRHFTVDGPGGVISFVLLPVQSRSAPDSMENGDTVGVFEQRDGILIGAFGATGLDERVLRELMRRMFA